MGADLSFGPAGLTPAFLHSKHGKDSLDFPVYLQELGLNAYEVQFTFGVKMGEKHAEGLGKNSKKAGIKLSVHAPYYAVLTSLKKGTVEKSRQHLLKSFKTAKILGAQEVNFHPGFYSGNPEKAKKQFIEEMRKVEAEARKLNAKQTCFSLEVTGKKSALGSLEDLIELCSQLELSRPCIDWAHLHARTGGSLKSKEDFLGVLEKLEKGLGKKAVKDLHSHLYPINFGEKGEKSHSTLLEKKPEPDYRLFLKAAKEFGLKGTVICESSGRQDLDAVEMRRQWVKVAGPIQ